MAHAPQLRPRTWYATLLGRALPLGLLPLLSSTGAGCGSGDDGLEVAHTTINGVECLNGAVACGADCAELDSSAEHCGACDVACGSEELCDLGRCRPRLEGCSSARLLCGSDCVDPLVDHDDCGACDQACPAEATCEAGACACPGALVACGESCVDTASDEQHCGGCDQRCVDSQTCEAGSCACPLGTELCSRTSLAVADDAVTLGASEAACVDTATDSQNCGACGVACVGGQVCDAGSCVCPADATFCGDSCVDTATDSENCGACGAACGGGQVCDAGSCVCPEGLELCDGQCVDTQSDVEHCGACGTACELGQGCSAGACESGALGEDGCEGLVSGLGISQVSVYQTVESVVARDGQAVDAPTPDVVAGRPSLLRVFVAPRADWTQRQISGRLFLANGDERATLYSASKLAPAAASQPEDRASTLEFLVAAEDVTPETRFAVELVECGGAVTDAAGDARFPESGAAPLNAIETGGLRLHLVPLRANGLLPDTSEETLNLYSSLFLDSYPISNIEITVGDPLDIPDPEDWAQNLDAVRALRQRDNAPDDVYYYGLLRPADSFNEFCRGGCVAGIGYVADGFLAVQGRVAMGLAYGDIEAGFIMLHEVGHNHGREHAPCVPRGAQISGVDPNYPQADGSVAVFGYNALGDQLLPPTATDVMGYCQNQWFSAYTYQGLLDRVVSVNQLAASEIVDEERVGAWQVVLADAARGLRWGVPIPGPAVAMGEPEVAQVLDAAGAVVQSVTVYRTRLSELDAASVQVPERQAGWSAIQLAGEAPLPFPGAP